MHPLIWIFALSLAALIAALHCAPRAQLLTRVDIDASPMQVWQVLASPQDYPKWNPFIVSMQGDLIEGRTLVNELRPSNGKRMRFKPVLLKVQAGRELRWRGRLLLPRLLDGEHFFELSPSADGRRTLLTHGESFHGVLLWLVDVSSFRSDFERMNAALKAQVERQ